jgi:hypothetical protein
MKKKLLYSLLGYVLIKSRNRSTINFDLVRREAQARDFFIYGDDFLKLNYQNFFNCDSVLCEIFGEYFKYTNGFVVQYNHHGINILNNSRQPVFHIDSDYDWFSDHKFVKKLNNLAKIGIYGQSYKSHYNVPAIPFSHLIYRIPTWLFGRLIGKVMLKLVNYLAQFDFFKSLMRIPIEQGDILIFDCLLLHASDDGEAHNKTVIYNEVGSKEGVKYHQIYNVFNRAIEENETNQQDFIRDPFRYQNQVRMYFDDALRLELGGSHFSHFSHQ